MGLGAWKGSLDSVYGVEALSLVLRGDEMDEAVQGYAGHYVYEEGSDFVEAMKHHGIPPHGNGDRVVAEG